MKKKILVVGGEGYIGQIVCNKLLEKNCEVISYDNLIYEQQTNNEIIDNNNYEFVNADIRDLIKIRENLKKVNAVIILAGLVGDPITKNIQDYQRKLIKKGSKI